jgi:hypothetical protein
MEGGSSRWRKEDERPDLDTFARRRIGRTRRVVESSMGGEPRPAIFLRVVALKKHHFVRLQVREVIPVVIGIVGKGVGLPNPVRVHEVTRQLKRLQQLHLCTGSERFIQPSS